MKYNKTKWVSGETTLSAENFNKIEEGIEQATNIAEESKKLAEDIIKSLEDMPDEQPVMNNIILNVSDLQSISTEEKENIISQLSVVSNNFTTEFDTTLFNEILLNNNNKISALLRYEYSSTDTVRYKLFFHTGSKNYILGITKDLDIAIDEIIYAKQEDLPDVSNFITEIPDVYITEEDLNAKGYLTQHQDISNKVNRTELNNFYDKETSDNKYMTPQKVDDRINQIITDAVDGDTLTNLTDLVDYLHEHGKEASDMAVAIQQLSNKQNDTYTKEETNSVINKEVPTKVEETINKNSKQVQTLDIGNSENIDVDSDNQIPTSKAVQQLINAAINNILLTEV
jgi:hypothetical protein